MKSGKIKNEKDHFILPQGPTKQRFNTPEYFCSYVRGKQARKRKRLPQISFFATPKSGLERFNAPGDQIGGLSLVWRDICGAISSNLEFPVWGTPASPVKATEARCYFRSHGYSARHENGGALAPHSYPTQRFPAPGVYHRNLCLLFLYLVH